MATLACAVPVANSVRTVAATRKERIFTFGLRAMNAVPRLSVPRHLICPGSGLCSSGLQPASLMGPTAQTRRRGGRNRLVALTFSRALCLSFRGDAQHRTRNLEIE